METKTFLFHSSILPQYLYFCHCLSMFSHYLLALTKLLKFQHKQEDVVWLLKVALKTVAKASQYKRLFQFMPEFYLEIVIHAHTALKNYFQPYTPFETVEGRWFFETENTSCPLCVIGDRH